MTRRLIRLYVAAALAALFAVSAAVAMPDRARVTKVNATMDAFQEVPKPRARRGTGEFAGTIRAGRLTWQIRFRALTGKALSAHIHLAPRGRTNPQPAVALCGPCRSGQRGSVRVSAAVLKRIKAIGAYVNVHTRRYPKGEIRGQLRAKTR